MKVEFVNHSSILFDSGKERVLCDPWYEGTAFANGWRLLNDNAVDINSLDFDYIWISHEHPDHFSVPTLRRLQTKVPVFYQQTKDRKVASYLKNQGHEIIELESEVVRHLEGCAISTIVTESYDSCLVIDSPNGRVLNVNDSQLDKEAEISKAVKQAPVDLVCIQFHYANWAGNANDRDIPEYKRKHAVERITKILRACESKNVLLFASFIYYCHEENFYWNQHSDNFLDTVSELQSMGINAIIMSPGDVLDLAVQDFAEMAANGNSRAIQFWKKKQQQIGIVEVAREVSLAELEKQYRRHIEKLSEKNRLDLLQQDFLSSFTLNIWLTDAEVMIAISPSRVRFEIAELATPRDADIFLSTEALFMLLSNDFALGSISISSRIQFAYEKAYKFYFFFLVPYRNNIGIYLSSSISKDLMFEGFKHNGVLKPIFHFHPDAARLFDDFTARLAALEPLNNPSNS